MTWHVVRIDGPEKGLLWTATPDAPLAEWYWLAERENPDAGGNSMPPDALAALIKMVES